MKLLIKTKTDKVVKVMQILSDDKCTMTLRVAKYDAQSLTRKWVTCTKEYVSI